MRAFVAVEIPVPQRAHLARRLRDVRHRLPAARWVREGAYHLTLLFLGEIGPDVAAEIETRLAPVFGACGPIPTRLAGGGTFPPGRPARVAWVGVESPEPLIQLGAAVRESCSQLAERPDHRPFRPHLTVARCRRPWPVAAAERWESTMAGAIGDRFTIDRGVLMRSFLEPGGARYEVVAAFACAGAS